MSGPRRAPRAVSRGEIINRVRNFDAARQTRTLRPDAAGIDQAAAILRRGGLVALPTETVYGLGAHALNPDAARAIFTAKGRPADDPLIVHLANAADVASVARLDAPAARLAEHFWPGPLTLVLPKLAVVPPEVTAGLPSVAVRVPAHPIAHEVLAVAGLPIAAPSANLFGRPSPTRAEHVLADLDGRIDAVLDGGPTPIGVESTIVALTDARPRLLRAGGVAAEAIEDVLGERLHLPADVGAGPQVAPGMLPSHYAPRTPLLLVNGSPRAARERLMHEAAAALAAGRRVGVVALDEDREHLPAGVVVEEVGAFGDEPRLASRLYDVLRRLDARGLDVLLVRPLADPRRGLGRALADRLRRAAQRVIAVADD